MFPGFSWACGLVDDRPTQAKCSFVIKAAVRNGNVFTAQVCSHHRR